MKRILILGYGYVGKAMTDFFKGHYNVEVYDPLLFGEKNASKISEFKRRYKGYNITRVENYEQTRYDLAVVCVPTPMAEDGSCDISMVSECVKKADAEVILIKSTIRPHTTDNLKKYNKRIVFSPEYIGEGKYYVTSRMDFQTNMKATPFMILGGDKEDCNYIFDLFISIAGPERTYFKTTALNAELIKYMENTYFGVKVTFANEMRNIVEAIGGDWYDVWQGWKLDPRVDVMHTAVFPDSRGFGGKCLPKDLNALVKASEQAGYKAEFLKQMLKSNEQFKKT